MVYINGWHVSIGLKKDQPIRIAAKQHHICGNQECKYECDDTNPVNNWECPKCGWNIHNIDYENRKILHKCINPDCGYEIYENSPVTNWTCPECGTTIPQINHHECNNPKCNYKEDSKCPVSRWICPKCGDDSHLYDVNHICENCGYKWIDKKPDNTCKCPKCGYVKPQEIIHICPDCNNIIVNNGPNFSCNLCGYSNIENKYHNKCTNPECQYEEDNKNPVNNWICPKCGWKPDNYILGNNIKFAMIHCKECNKETPHDKNNKNKCLVCSGDYIWCNIHKKWETKNEYNEESIPNRCIMYNCDICNLITPHKYIRVTASL